MSSTVLISPQVSRWRRRPPDHAMTVSTCPGALPATIAPPQCPRPRRRIEKKACRSATATTTCTGSNSPIANAAFPFRSHSSMTPGTGRPSAGRPARRNPAWRLRRPVQQIQGDEDHQHGQGHVYPEAELRPGHAPGSVSYTHLRAHETRHDLVCRLLLEKKKK